MAKNDCVHGAYVWMPSMWDGAFMSLDSRIKPELEDWVVVVEYELGGKRGRRGAPHQKRDGVMFRGAYIVQASSGANAWKLWEINHPTFHVIRSAVVRPEQVFQLGEVK